MPESRVQEEENVLETNIDTVSVMKPSGKPTSFLLELDLFLALIGITLSATALSNIVLYRACVHSLHHSVEECHPFLSPVQTNETKNLEVEIQKYVTYIGTAKSIVEYLGPAILCLFLGVWSDTHGRKPLIVWPLFGISLTAMLTVVYSMMDNLGPWWIVAITIPTSLTGGMSVLGTGIYCCLSDMTDQKSMSFRMMSIEIAVAVGSVVGSLSSSYLLNLVGNVCVLLIAATMFVMAYAVTNVWLQESVATAVPGTLLSVFNFSSIKEMITECFKSRPNYLRSQILIITIASSFNVFLLYGVVGLDYLYTRGKLHWALKEYNQYSAVNVIITFFGSYLMVAVVQKRFNVNDISVSILGYASSAGSYAIRTFAVDSWHMYLASGVAAFGGLSAPLMRSYLTKVVPPTDVAKVFALTSAVCAVVPLFSPPIYNSLYNLTLATFPGAIMLLSSLVCVSCIVLLLFVMYLRWKSQSGISYLSVNSATDEPDD